MSWVGLNYREHVHFLDHLGPVCALLGAPLLCTSDVTAALARAHYPGLRVLELDRAALSADWLAERFTGLIQTDALPVRRGYTASPEALAALPDLPALRERNALMFEVMLRRAGPRLRNLHVPHGFSDKAAILKLVAFEDLALVYGQRLLELLHREGVAQHLGPHVVCGNLRFGYFQQHRAFYQRAVEVALDGALRPGRRTFLYAPTWQDGHLAASSFFEGCTAILDGLPEGDDIIVKLHPHLLHQAGEAVRSVCERYAGRRNVVFLREHPLVFPFLARADVYLGDVSSVGYDFLAFDRPMFFLNQKGGAHPLFSCGTQVGPEQYRTLFTVVDRALKTDRERFGAVRAETWRAAFAPCLSAAELQAGLARACAAPVAPAGHERHEVRAP
ncbi:MAG: CDP-glycerol glycerophosphotransferase family protein [Archangiaceae bacterium]|nr:CDP-glycerol glycerophosphotransferase family protein [Archangiaceae bacterium]